MSALDSDDDSDMRRAIALSLGQPDPAVHNAGHGPIDLTSDSPPQSGPSQPPPPSSLGVLGLDRVQMERERLARKREADGPPPSSPTPKSAKLEASDFPISTAALQYPAGVVKKTYCRGFPRDGSDITLREVLQPQGLKMAILSAFMWNVDWVFSHLNWKGGTRIICVMQAKDEATKDTYRQEMEHRYSTGTGGAKNVRLCFPSMEGGVNCMHSKLMVLSYDGFLRVAVPTANLVPYDWGEDGTMENSVFLIDLPRRKTTEDLTHFGQELTYFMRAKGIDKSIIDSLHNFDWTATKNLAFVHTIGGSHIGSPLWQRTGYPGLSHAVKHLGLKTEGKLEIDFVTSSVGALNMSFLSNIYRACQGEDFSQDPDRKKNKKTPWNQNMPADDLESTVKEHFRVYFPTHETVTSSIAGTAGTICMQSNYYNAPAFPQSLLRDCRSIREGVLMHNKIIFVRPSAVSSSTAPTPWAYIGSANCSESAWGNKITRDRATKETKLFARNWECGVLIRCPWEAKKGDEVNEAEGGCGSDGGPGEGGGLQATFSRGLPVPMKAPGEKYGDGRPWFFMKDG